MSSSTVKMASVVMKSCGLKRLLRESTVSVTMIISVPPSSNSLKAGGARPEGSRYEKEAVG